MQFEDTVETSIDNEANYDLIECAEIHFRSPSTNWGRQIKKADFGDDFFCTKRLPISIAERSAIKFE